MSDKWRLRIINVLHPLCLLPSMCIVYIFLFRLVWSKWPW